jgi:Flp pilus assembly protein TadB
MLADRPHGRRLTATERMQLDDLERHLREDDAALADALRDGRPPPGRHRRAVSGGTAVALALLALLAALFGGLVGLVTLAIVLLAVFTARRAVRRHRERS